MADSTNAPLAWAGWRMTVPAPWRPLRIEGAWRRGAMMVGDGEQALFQVKWLRPKQKNLQGERWIKQRLKALGAFGRTRKGKGAAAGGFAETAWTPAKGQGRSFWHGCAPGAGLLIEVAVNSALEARIVRRIESKTLPSMMAFAREKPTRWAVFGASFESPAGYALKAHRLHLGDVALRLSGEKGTALMLRQVYPAKLAVERRKVERWLEISCFKEFRLYRSDGAVRPWTVNGPGGKSVGVIRRGWKRMPFPFGACAARSSVDAAVHDTDLDRLLLAGHDTPGRADESVLVQALGAMNWALREGGKAT
jgi:hypothetical protein